MDNAPVQEEPRDIEAEKAVLGAAFLSKNALADAMEYLEPQDFYRKAHQIIFEKMVQLNDADQPIDPLTMKNVLDQDNQTENVGGVAYIAELATAVPTAANVVYYSKIVHDKAISRRLINTATKIINDSYAGNDKIEDQLDRAEQEIMSVSENSRQTGFKSISDVLQESINHVSELSSQDSEITGLSTGYAQLDEMTTGLHKDELVIIAARPAVGKTAFVLNIAQNVATRTDNTVAIFSLEMSAESLANRMLCAEGNINANHLRTGQLTQDEWQSLFIATGALSNASIYIDDTPGIKVAEIRARCRRLAKEKGNLGLIVIDYLQLIEGSNPDNRQQEVSEISRQLKKLAKELEVPVIALSQLSRELNSDKTSARFYLIFVNLDRLNRMQILLVSFIVMTIMSTMKIRKIIITREIIRMTMDQTLVKLKSSSKRIVVVRGGQLNYYLQSLIISSLRFPIFLKIIIKN